MVGPALMLLGVLVQGAAAPGPELEGAGVGGPPHRGVYAVAASPRAPYRPVAERTPAAPGDTLDASVGRSDPPAASDTVRRRVRAVEVSDGYALRLRIHRYASYTTIPLFAAQTVAGHQLYQSGGSAPQWAKTLHVAGAGGLGALFGINTVTGVWNLWETRASDAGRGRRLLHGGLMLAADAGFAYTGIRLGPEATQSGESRRAHRRAAMLSMSVALAGYATMLVGER